MDAGCDDRAVRLLALDGAACAGAGLLVVLPRVGRELGLSARARWAAGLALAGTSALLLGAAQQRARPRALRLAACLNAGWVAACLLGLRGVPGRCGAVLLIGTAAVDAAAGTGQLLLSCRSGPVRGPGRRLRRRR